MRLADGTSLPTVTAAPSVRVAATKSATEPPRSNPTTPMRSALTSRSASQPNAVSVSATIWSRSSRSALLLGLVRGHLVGGVAVVEVRGDGEPPVAREALHETPHRVGDPPRVVQHDDPAPDRRVRLGDREP